jgi:hypothetical protein
MPLAQTSINLLDSLTKEFASMAAYKKAEKTKINRVMNLIFLLILKIPPLLSTNRDFRKINLLSFFFQE